MAENRKRLPRRYGVGGDGRIGRTWGGKLPEEFGTKEKLLFAADNDLALYGRLTVDTLNAVREAGFRYEAGSLLSLQDLERQGRMRDGRYPEVYRLSFGEAKMRGEKERFWASEREDSCCVLAMDSAVLMNFKDGALKPGCLDRIVEEYGYDRMDWVLAHTICRNRGDADISQENKEWAAGFHVPQNDPVGGSLWLSCILQIPGKVVETVTNLVREGHARQKEEKQQKPKAREKPSIRKQLAAGGTTAKGDDTVRKVADREAR